MRQRVKFPIKIVKARLKECTPTERLARLVRAVDYYFEEMGKTKGNKMMKELALKNLQEMYEAGAQYIELGYHKKHEK